MTFGGSWLGAEGSVWCSGFLLLYEETNLPSLELLLRGKGAEHPKGA